MRRVAPLLMAVTITGCAGGIPPIQFTLFPPPAVVIQPDTVQTVNPAAMPRYTPPTGGFTRQPVSRYYRSYPRAEPDLDEPTIRTTPPPANLVQRILSPSGIPYRIRERRRMVLTAYNSDPRQTDDTPWKMADGRLPTPGDAACNGLPIGTRFRIPELFDDFIFTVEDRMAAYIGGDHVDVWVYHISDAYALHHPTVTIEVLDAPSSFAPR